MFWKRKNLFESSVVVMKAITDLRIDLDVLKSQVKHLELEEIVLRNFVKDKIKRVKSVKEDEGSEDINKSVFLTPDGKSIGLS